MRIRDVALPALTCALLVGTAQIATAPPAAAVAASWTADLGGGDAVGVVVADGTVRLDRSDAHLLPADSDGAPVPTGLLTLDSRGLPAPTDRIGTAVDGDLPAGSTAAVDVRGRRDGGGWTEWVPAVDGVAALPEPVRQVQGRVVLAAEGEAVPEVRDVELSALPADERAEAEGTEAAAVPQQHRVFATREGLVGGTTANGHVIAERDHFVALPSRRALSPRGTGDYSVEVCAPSGRCAFAPVWDVGPWNTRDDYWNPPAERQEWKDLPQGVPQAQAARLDGYHGGRDQYGRVVANPAGIDLGDGLFWDALGLRDNSWVTVDYLWTGTARLAPVVAAAPVELRAAPSADAAVVGVAAPRAAVPVECALAGGDRTWLRVGQDQYVDAAAVPVGGVPACAAGGGGAESDAARTAAGGAVVGEVVGDGVGADGVVADGVVAADVVDVDRVGGEPAGAGPVGAEVIGDPADGSTVEDAEVGDAGAGNAGAGEPAAGNSAAGDLDRRDRVIAVSGNTVHARDAVEPRRAAPALPGPVVVPGRDAGTADRPGSSGGGPVPASVADGLGPSGGCGSTGPGGSGR